MFKSHKTTKIVKSDLQECYSHRLHKRRSEGSLGAGDLSQLVKLPPGEELLDWLLQHCTDFYHEVHLLYRLLASDCTEASCPTMLAGPKFEYKWADGTSVKKPLRSSHRSKQKTLRRRQGWQRPASERILSRSCRRCRMPRGRQSARQTRRLERQWR